MLGIKISLFIISVSHIYLFFYLYFCPYFYLHIELFFRYLTFATVILKFKTVTKVEEMFFISYRETPCKN